MAPSAISGTCLVHMTIPPENAVASGPDAPSSRLWCGARRIHLLFQFGDPCPQWSQHRVDLRDREPWGDVLWTVPVERLDRHHDQPFRRCVRVLDVELLRKIEARVYVMRGQ